MTHTRARRLLVCGFDAESETLLRGNKSDATQLSTCVEKALEEHRVDQIRKLLHNAPMEDAVKAEAIMRQYVLRVKEFDRLTNVGAIAPVYLELFVRLFENDRRDAVLAEPLGADGLRRDDRPHGARAPRRAPPTDEHQNRKCLPRISGA